MKYLALEKELNKGEKQSIESLLESEARRVYELYLQGIIRECYFSKEGHNAVIIMECKNEKEVHKTLKTLPLVKENIIEFQLFTLLPYSGLNRIYNKNK
jgi:muconolactone delta-isomerase